MTQKTIHQNWLASFFRTNPRIPIYKYVFFWFLVSALVSIVIIGWYNSRLTDIKAGMKEEEVIQLMGEPTRILKHNSRVTSADAIHFFQISVPINDSSSGPDSSTKLIQTPGIHAVEMPAVKEFAYWYDYFPNGYLGGVLIYFEKGATTEAYKGVMD